MKIDVRVKELERDDFTSLFDSDLIIDYMGIECNFDDWVGIPKKKRSEGNSWNDFIFDVLFNGGCIEIVDKRTKGKAYGNLPREIEDNEEGWVTYKVTLKDFMRGLSLDCVRDEVAEFVMDKGDGKTKYDIMQAILFGEVIYK